MTVENLVMTGVCTPGARKTSAQVRWEMSWVTCTTHSAVTQQHNRVNHCVLIKKETPLQVDKRLLSHEQAADQATNFDTDCRYSIGKVT